MVVELSRFWCGWVMLWVAHYATMRITRTDTVVTARGNARYTPLHVHLHNMMLALQFATLDEA
jgi:hypothetical protein